MNTEKPNRGKALALTGAFLQLGPIVGMVGTTIGMMHAFKTLESSNGISDPQRLSANISEVLIATVVGLGLSLTGLVLICIALFASRYRAPWFFWFLVIYGAILLCGFPVGTVIGIIILVYCLTNKAQFLSVNESERNA